MNTKKRLQVLRNKMQEKKAEISLVFEPDNQYYLTDFKAISYTRPIATIIKMNAVELIIPALEDDHARQDAKVDTIHVYYEHPEQASNGISCFEHLQMVLKKANVKDACK